MNKRAHRKLLVVDGRIGFTGGVGIAGLWTGHAQDSMHWRDSHFRIEGPVAAQLHAAFMDNWVKATGGSESMELMYLLARGASKSRWGDLLAAGAPALDSDRPGRSPYAHETYKSCA